jgi:hypothetical protein
MTMASPQFQGVATQPFNHLAEETIHIILSFLLAREEPIHIGIWGVYRPFSKVCSLLRVSHRFHRIAEHIIYNSNTFEVWSSDIWLFDFLTNLSALGRRMITKLRIQWPDRICPAAPQEILELIASCAGLTRVEFFCFPKDVALPIVGGIAFLQVDEIWFETISCHTPDLTIFGCTRAREQRVFIQRSD